MSKMCSTLRSENSSETLWISDKAFYMGHLFSNSKKVAAAILNHVLSFNCGVKFVFYVMSWNPAKPGSKSKGFWGSESPEVDIALLEPRKDLYFLWAMSLERSSVQIRSKLWPAGCKGIRKEENESYDQVIVQYRLAMLLSNQSLPYLVFYVHITKFWRLPRMVPKSGYNITGGKVYTAKHYNSAKHYITLACDSTYPTEVWPNKENSEVSKVWSRTFL